MRVLAEATHSKSLKPAAEHWRQQMKQPLEVRLGTPRSLHDRLILIDGKTAFVLGQSFKDLATRAHTSLVRMPPDAASLKIDAYELMWSSATSLYARARGFGSPGLVSAPEKSGARASRSGLLFCGGPAAEGVCMSARSARRAGCAGFLRPGKNPGAYTSATHWRLPYSPKRAVPLGVPAGWPRRPRGSRLSPETMRSR